MGSALKAKIKQQADFDSPAVEAILNLMVATDTVRGQLERVLAAHEITYGQYNVLRILRGAGCAGHPRCEIAARMLERSPDITRIVDRLEKQGLVARNRSDEDRRHSVTKISQKGLEVLDKIKPKLLCVLSQLSDKLSTVEWVALTSICEKIYAEQSEALKQTEAI